METVKSFAMGMIVMALIASVAFNIYQMGQLNQAVIMPSAQKGMDLK